MPNCQLINTFIDLRGNPGGGIGGLTLMSYLKPSHLPIGLGTEPLQVDTTNKPGTLPVAVKGAAIPTILAPTPGACALTYELIMPFFSEEIRALLVDPTISDLMINGTTGVLRIREALYKRLP